MGQGKVKVPEGMLTAFMAGRGHQTFGDFTEEYRRGLAAALEWLQEHPIVPTDEQCDAQWQRRMFRAPEPDAEIADLLSSADVRGTILHDVEADDRIREAYRRGKEAATRQ